MILISFLVACSEITTTNNTTQQTTSAYITSEEDTMSSQTNLDTTTNLTTTQFPSGITSISTAETTTFLTTVTTVSTEITSCETKGIENCRYSLSEALSNGLFEEAETYEDLSDAQVILRERTNPNLVVLDQDDTVVAMKYGAVNFRTKSISETTTLGHTGFRYPTYLNGHYNVDGVYLDSVGVIVYGMIAGVRFEVVNSEIELIPDIHLKNAYSYYEVVDGELVHRISYQLSSADFQSIGAIDIAPDYLEEGVRYYSYDNHYFFTDFIVMTDDLRNNTYEHAINSDSPYYNYYQYLSFRSQTNYTADELNAYISSNVGTSSALYDSGEDFINAQDSVYINGAMELAFAIHESGWGSSRIAKDKNNLFGINAYDSDPYNSATTFETVQDCIEYHVQYFLGMRYFNPKYYVGFGTNFGNKYQGMNYKYASDAYWGEKIAKHYYNLDKALGFKDRNSYQIALLHPDALGYYSPNLDSPVVYNPSTYTYRGLWIPFPIMKEKDEFYVLRLPLGLNDNYEMDINEIMGPTDVFYVLKEHVIIIN